MDKNHAIKLLREQIEVIDSLKHTPPYNPEYKIWRNTTEKLIKEAFDDSYVQLFNHQGVVSIGLNPVAQMHNFIEKLEEKRALIEGFIKEDERFCGDGSALNISSLKSFQKYNFHSEINLVSGQLLIDGHYSQAIEEALKKVVKKTRDILKEKTGEEIDGDKLMNRMFGFENQEPVIKFNSLSSFEEKDEQRGILYLFKGIVGIRNRKAHENIIQHSYERAVEYLGLASLLMRLLDDYSTESA